MSESYASLLRAPGVARVMSSQLVARFPSGMLALGVLMHVEQVFGSYGAAGIVLSMTSVGQALAGPVTSRMMGRFGSRRVLISTTLISAAAILVLALAALPLWGYLVAGLVSGLATPPVQPAVRTIYPKLVDGKLLPRLFSLDASAQEIIWVVGPLVITVVSREISTTLGLLVCAGILVLGGAWFIASPELGTVKIVRSTQRIGVVLAKPGVLLGTVTGMLLIGGASAIEVGIIARFGEGGIEAGIALAASAVASLAGGLTLGHLAIKDGSLALRLAIVAAGAGIALVATGVWTTSMAMLVFGFGIAPALAVMYTMVADSTDFSDSAEAYGWLGTGQLVGAAIGAAIAGFMIDNQGEAGGFIVALAIVALGVLVAAVFRRARPHPKGEDLLAEAH